MTRPGLGAALVIGAASLWGSLGLFAKVLYEAGLDPLELASFRAAFAFLGMLAWTLASGRRELPRLRDLPFFAAYGVAGFAIFEYLFFATVERTTVAVAVALLYTAPAFVVLLSTLVEDEALGRVRLAALGLVLAGVFLVTGAAGAVLVGGAPLPPAAVALGLGSGLTYGLYTLMGKRALRRYAPAPTLLFSFAFAALALGVAAPPWEPLLRRPDAAPALLAVGLFPTLAAYLLYLGGLRHLPASTASILASAEPVIAALLAAAILGEPLGPERGAGVVLVVAAAALLARETPVTRPPPAPRSSPSARRTPP